MIKKAKLTNPRVEAFAGGGRYESGKKKGQPREIDILWDTLEPGFGVRYALRSGTRTYFYQRRVRGALNDRSITIGRHAELVEVDGNIVPLNASLARDKAAAFKMLMKAGIDPVEKERADREAERLRLAEEKRQREEAVREGEAKEMTFRQVMEHYLEHRRTRHGPLRQSTQADIRRHCEKNLTEWLDLPVATITRDMCLAAFTRITERGAKIQANLAMD